MKRQVVFLLSTNYAGSHFLALQLGSHSRCLSLGEFHRYGRAPDEMTRSACSACPSDEECPVFRGVYGACGRKLFDQVFENLSTFSPNVMTVVDNSKKWSWAGRFLDMEGYDLRFIHLIRDPRALVRRWFLNSEERHEARKVRFRTARRLPLHALSILFGSEDNVYTHKWVMQNRQITDFLGKHQLPHRVVAYGELVHFPERVLGEIMTWLGHEYEAEQREYWNFAHHGSQKAEYMKPSEGGKLHDQRWREYFAEDVQNRIANHPQVRCYIDKLGISLGPDGLARHPEWFESDSAGNDGE